ncbi:MAG: GxxExxY protein [Candidatus Omnitrophica bacterium]|nr:GxxExxY protein [Candidatus Omnitrophota bacterium]MDD5351655.1 GxxExxY protein [Candidatus Omnitrophota bacterium]MDD5550865.1 GxxExxY protein [Candidatus Omnitrophota bacterium]
MVDKEELNAISQKVIGLAFDVHNELGPGFIERIYSEALALEFARNNVKFEKEKTIKIGYKGKELGEQRIDFLIEGEIILEIKAAESISKIHLAQILSYLKALNKKLGLILNFCNTKLEIKRVVNNF